MPFPVESFCIKVVEPIKKTVRSRREELIQQVALLCYFTVRLEEMN
jgi:hypothetical protein